MDFHSHNSVAVLTFAKDAGYPRLTRSVLSELADLLAAVRREGSFEGVVIGANSESFAVAADIEELAALDGIAAWEFSRAGQALFDLIEHFPLPVVAAIRGFCLGGGLDLALACHARVATYDSSFGHPGGIVGSVDRLGRNATHATLDWQKSGAADAPDGRPHARHAGLDAGPGG